MPERVSFNRAFNSTFEQYFSSIFRYIDRLSGDPDLAADIAQETFVRLYERGEFPDDIRGWLAAVAANLFRDDRRTSRRRLELLTSQPSELTMGSPPIPAETAVLREEQRKAVRSLLNSLPMRDRQLLLLRHEGYSYREIASSLGIAEGSVGTLLMRATAAFSAALREDGRAFI
jgi:RNA polymerase sigma-70 factor (ECF subfamily)